MSVVNLEPTSYRNDYAAAPTATVRPLSRPSAPREIARPVAKPRIQVAPKVQVRSKAKADPAASLGLRAFAFIALFSATYVASNLSGQVMVERARRAELSARERAREASRSEASLRARVDSLKDADSIEAWAKSHGYTTPMPAKVNPI